ncbi:MAG: hypothetical protein ABEK12_02910 [Candidatus Nanohaloarchaea archaeon]
MADTAASPDLSDRAVLVGTYLAAYLVGINAGMALDAVVSLQPLGIIGGSGDLFSTVLGFAAVWIYHDYRMERRTG